MLLEESMKRASAPLAGRDQVRGQRAPFRVDLHVRRDVRGVDDRCRARLHAVMQEHGVEDGSRVRPEAERDIGDAQASKDEGSSDLMLANPSIVSTAGVGTPRRRSRA